MGPPHQICAHCAMGTGASSLGTRSPRRFPETSEGLAQSKGHVAGIHCIWVTGYAERMEPSALRSADDCRPAHSPPAPLGSLLGRLERVYVYG